MQEVFSKWKQSNNELVKLQWVYAVVGIVVLVAAGLVGLINDPLSAMLLTVVTFCFGIMVINFVVWSVVQNFVEAKPKRTRK